jgi:hypothetical protein
MCREILQFIAYKCFFFHENLTHTQSKKVGFGWVVMRSLDSGFGRKGDFRIAGKWGRMGKKWGAGRRLLD